MESLGLYDTLLTVLYFLLWVVTFLVYHKKYKTVDAGSAIIGSYILYAGFSIHNTIDPTIVVAYEPLSIFPFIFLYIMLMVALAPVIYHHTHPALKIEDPGTFVVKGIAMILILCAIFRIPEIVENIQEGLIRLFLDSEAGMDSYTEQLDNVGDSGKAISNIPAIVFNMFSDIGIFLFFYFLSQRKYLWSLFLSLPLVVSVLVPIMSGQRGPVVICILTIIMTFFLFKEYLTRLVVKITYGIGIFFGTLVSLPLIAITMSRFGERSNDTFAYISWYIGQANLYFNNFAFDAGGIRYGDRTAFLIKKLIDPSTPSNYEERRAKYANLKIDDYYFSTFVGDFCIDYGPIIGMLIILGFSLFMLYRISRFRSPDQVKLHQLLLLFFVACICMQGGMYLFAYSDTGNLKIVAFVLLYLYLLYHDGLLQRFGREPYELK